MRLGGWGEVKLAAMRPRTDPRLVADEPALQLVNQWDVKDPYRCALLCVWDKTFHAAMQTLFSTWCPNPTCVVVVLMMVGVAAAVIVVVVTKVSCCQISHLMICVKFLTD